MDTTFGTAKYIPLKASPKPVGLARESQIPNLKSQISNLKSRGFTLLEVLLSLALAGVVVLMISTTVYVYLRTLDGARADVEEAQLARALLNQIANDVRGALQYDPMQADKLLSQATAGATSAGSSNSAAQAGGGSDASNSAGSSGTSAQGLSSLASQAGLDSSALSGSNSSNSSSGSTSSDPTSMVIATSVPHLYGESNYLQVDVSRLPRLDQFDSLVVPVGDSSQMDRLSEAKTVAYYVINPGGPNAGGTGSAAGAAAGGQSSGLVRIELDRAVTAWSGLDGVNLNPTPIAPEVASIEFSYFDGSDWWPEWDSMQQGKLPVAVGVAIAINPPAQNNGRSGALLWAAPATGDTAAAEQPPRTYRMVVRLSAAGATQWNCSTQSSQDSSTGSQDLSASAGTSAAAGTGSGAGGTGGTSTGSGSGSSGGAGGGKAGSTSGSGSGSGASKGSGSGASSGSGSGGGSTPTPSPDPGAETDPSKKAAGR